MYAELVSGLSPARWESIAVVPKRDWLWQELETRGVEPVLLAGTRSFDVGYLSRLASLARTRGVRTIQTHLLGSAVYGAAVARLLRLPQVSTFHGGIDVSSSDPYLRVKLRILDRPANRLVFVSRSLLRHFEMVARPRHARTSVVHNGIDVETFRPGEEPDLRRELGVGPGELLLGAIGNLRPAKDYPTLLRAVAELVRRGTRCRCVVVGQSGGALAAQLLALRDELGLADTVEFTGFRSDVDRLVRAFDMLVISSSSEGFSLTAVQALASGTPVVATRSGGPEEILEDGAGGLLVASESPTALADGILRMSTDARARAAFIARGRRIVEARFSLPRMISDYESLYEELLEPGPGAA